MKEWFYTITQSMLELGLRGTELNLFAVIYGYSQKGDGCFYGTRGELCERCGVSSLRTIDSALASLIEKGLVTRFDFEKNGKQYTGYGCAKIAQSGCANSARVDVQKLHGGCAKIARGEGAKSAHKENKYIEKKEKINNTTTGRPSVEDVADYVKSRGFSDPVGFASFFVTFNDNRDWIGGNGKPILNWKNNIISNWESKNKDKVFTASQSEHVTLTRSDINKKF